MKIKNLTLMQTNLAIILLVALLSTIYNSFLDLHPDEGYYWAWTQHLQGGYFDHAPMIAYFLKITTFFSDTVWGIKLVGVITMSLSAWILVKLTVLISDEKTSQSVLFIFLSAILAHAGLTITTPDSPFILFWTLSLYTTYRALFENSNKYFVYSGISIGLMMMSKYNAVLFVLFILLFLLIKRRDVFTNIYLYVASIIAIIIVSPMLVWNYNNEWISFLFQLKHGGAGVSEINLNKFFEFFGGQFLIFTPIFAGVLFYYLVAKRAFIDNNKYFYLALSVLTPLLFFLYKGLYAKMELNYASSAYIGGAILLGIIYEKYQLKKLFIAGITLALFLTFIVRIAFIAKPEIILNMYGTKIMIDKVATLSHKDDAFYGSHYGVAGLMGFYLPNHPQINIITPARFSQYDMWREDMKPKDGLLLSTNKESHALNKLFKHHEIVYEQTFKNGPKGERTLYIYRVSDAK